MNQIAKVSQKSKGNLRKIIKNNEKREKRKEQLVKKMLIKL